MNNENFNFLGRTFDIDKAKAMVACGEVVDQGQVPIKNIWKWINVIDVDQDYALQMTKDHLLQPVILAKFENEDLLIDGYHRLTKAMSIRVATLPFASILAQDVLI